VEEKRYLVQFLKIIVEQLAWGPPESWSQQHYNAFSDRIFKKTNQIVHPRTIKRIFGLYQGSDYNPHISTKDILAQYMDFENWDAFRANSTSKKTIHPISHGLEFEKTNEYQAFPALKTKSNLGKYIGVAVSVFLVGICILWYFLTETDQKVKTFKIHSEVSDSSVLPVTHTLYFNEPVHDSDKVFNLQYNGFLWKRNPVVTDSLFNLTYFLPGLYRLKVVRNQKDSILFQRNVLVPSIGWTSVVGYDYERANPNHHSSRPAISKNGILFLDPENVKYYKDFDESKVYYVTYRKFGHTGIDGDNAFFTARTISNESLGGVSCFDNLLFLRCTKGDLRLQFVKEGCQSFVVIQAANTKYSGIKRDLKTFCADIENGISYRFKTSGNKLLVYLDQNKIFEMDYEGELGEVLGIEFLCKGNGGVDHYSLQSNSDSTKREAQDF